jgi:hypothetical protein
VSVYVIPPSTVSSIPPTLHTNSFTHHRHYINLTNDSVVEKARHNFPSAICRLSALQTTPSCLNSEEWNCKAIVVTSQTRYQATAPYVSMRHLVQWRHNGHPYCFSAAVEHQSVLPLAVQSARRLSSVIHYTELLVHNPAIVFTQSHWSKSHSHIAPLSLTVCSGR